MAGAPWWEQFDPGPRDPGPTGEARQAPGTDTLAPTGPRVVADDGGNRAAPPPPRPPRGLQVVAAVLALVLVALLGVLAARTVGASSVPAPQEGTAGGPTSAPAPTSGPAAGGGPGGTAAADAAATAELEELRRQGLQAHPPQGQWVAQLAAKSVGTTDPVQTAANGSSTFYAADILAQSREIASGVAGGDVFVLKTTDFGDGLVDKRDNPYWVTLAAGPFGNADDVRTWCASMFATTPADERGNVCLPKRLTPPG